MKSVKSKMTPLILVITIMTTKMINPLIMSLTIMAISVLSAGVIFKTLANSWLILVLVMTFSSGMMTLFIYIASLTPMQKKKCLFMTPILTLMMLKTSTVLPFSKQTKTTMKMFSNQTAIILMTMILILTLLTISQNSFNPNQSISTNF